MAKTRCCGAPQKPSYYCCSLVCRAAHARRAGVRFCGLCRNYRKRKPPVLADRRFFSLGIIYLSPLAQEAANFFSSLIEHSPDYQRAPAKRLEPGLRIPAGVLGDGKIGYQLLANVLRVGQGDQRLTRFWSSSRCPWRPVRLRSNNCRRPSLYSMDRVKCCDKFAGSSLSASFCDKRERIVRLRLDIDADNLKARLPIPDTGTAGAAE